MDFGVGGIDGVGGVDGGRRRRSKVDFGMGGVDGVRRRRSKVDLSGVSGIRCG